MLSTAIALPGGVDGLWTLVFVPASIAIAALGGVIGIALSRGEQSAHRAAAETRGADRDG